MQQDLFSRTTRERIADLDPYTRQNAWLEKCDADDVLDKLLYADTKTYLHELLMKQDQMSMAASIESRVPFLDHKLVEFSARMPREMKLRGNTTKWILREAMKGMNMCCPRVLWTATFLTRATFVHSFPSTIVARIMTNAFGHSSILRSGSGDFSTANNSRPNEHRVHLPCQPFDRDRGPADRDRSVVCGSS
jgi:hypothetical protein